MGNWSRQVQGTGLPHEPAQQVFSRSLRLALGALAAALSACASTAPHGEIVGVLKSLSNGYKHRDPNEVVAVYTDDFQVEDALARTNVVCAVEGSVHAHRMDGVLDRNAYRDLLTDDFGQITKVDGAKFILDNARSVDGGYEVDSSFNFFTKLADGSRRHETSKHRFFVVRNDVGLLEIQRQRILHRTWTEGDEPQFVDRTVDAGLAAFHQPHTPIDDSTPVIPGNFSGAGASAGDYDGDQYLDLVVGDGVRTRLYRNKRDGTFEEVTDAAGLGTIAKVRGAYFVDYDNDGRLDLFFTRVKQPAVLMRNEGDGTFADASEALGPQEPGQGESAAFADLDNDGDIDIWQARYGDFDQDSWAFPIYDATDGQPDVVLRNRGDGTFEELRDPDLTPAGWGLAVAMADYDNDRDQDVYIVNDFGVNHLLRNDGDWKFTNVTDETGTVDQGFGMSASWGDVDNDGDLDMYVANMQSSAGWVFEDSDYPLPVVADILFLRPFVRRQMRTVTRGNSLMVNRGDGTFEESAAAFNVERNGWAWGANYLDYDNDGDLDIYCPAGFITGDEPDDL